MRNKNKPVSDYTRLKAKLLLRFAITAGISFVLLSTIYSLAWQGRIADTTVRLLQKLPGMDYWGALEWYQVHIRNYADILFLAAVLVVFFVLLRVVLKWFTGYFDLINVGIGSLLDGDGHVRLPDEMLETERKLNSVKDELKSRAEEREAAEKRKNDLVMYLAHDIRTPLTSIIGYLNLINEKTGVAQEKKDEYAEVALDKSYRLEKMLNELFDITRYTAQEIRIRKEPIDLYCLLVQLTDEMLPIFNSNGNTIRLDADENIAVFGDPEKLARALNNVLKNAASYSDPDTEILVSASPTDAGVSISVSNRGSTLSHAELDTIFDKFARLDSARSSATGGTGLGLAIAKEIIELHGGKIRAESQDHEVIIMIWLPAGTD